MDEVDESGLGERRTQARLSSTLVWLGWLWCLASAGTACVGKLSIPHFISLHHNLIQASCRAMAPHAGFTTDHIKEKARKDLLYLLEGVSKGP